MALTIGVDIGGTKVGAGVVDEAGQILTRVRRVTPPRDSPGTLAAILDAIRELRAAHDVEAVGLGAAGFVDARRSIVLFAPNVGEWRDQPLRDVVQRSTGLPAVVENDANAAAWGESTYGAGVGEDFLVCVTVGTGLGGGIIVDGQLYRGRFGVAAEFGHMRVEPDGRLCGCGNRGCWEQYASGKALVKEARERAAADPGAAGGLLARGDGTPEGIKGTHVTEAAREGDPVALSAFRVLAGWLGQGLADMAAVLDPGRFVIGGGVSEAGDLLLGPTREAFVAALSVSDYRPHADIRAAQLGNSAGIVGAADLARLR